jgi:hypothetical protein
MAFEESYTRVSFDVDAYVAIMGNDTLSSTSRPDICASAFALVFDRAIHSMSTKGTISKAE